MVHKEGRGPSSANLTGEGEDIKWEPMETEQPSETEAPVESKQREQEVWIRREARFFYETESKSETLHVLGMS